MNLSKYCHLVGKINNMKLKSSLTTICETKNTKIVFPFDSSPIVVLPSTIPLYVNKLCCHRRLLFMSGLNYCTYKTFSAILVFPFPILTTNNSGAWKIYCHSCTRIFLITFIMTRSDGTISWSLHFLNNGEANILHQKCSCLVKQSLDDCDSILFCRFHTKLTSSLLNSKMNQDVSVRTVADWDCKENKMLHWR